MSNKKQRIIFQVLSIFFVGCATYSPQYKVENTVQTYPNNKTISHSFYLVGDAGYSTPEKNSPVLEYLHKELEDKTGSLLFLGDNVYPAGLPKKKHVHRKQAENRLDHQIAVAKNFKGNPIFIPGNHDWYADGVAGVKREQKYIEKALNSKKVFFPQNGCPLQKIKISDNIVVIAIDTEWYLANWDKNPTMNDDCEIKDRTKFFEELEGLIKKNANKTTLIAMHHPMFSYGIHGGQYAAKQYFFPTHGNVPIPVLSGLVNVVRKTGGISTTDLNNARYRALRKRIVTLAQFSENVIFASGHEHSLQYIVEENTPQIVSGSGAIESAARCMNGSAFSYGGFGYAKLDVFDDGSSWVQFFGIVDGMAKKLFETEVLKAKSRAVIQEYPETFPERKKDAIYRQEEITKSRFFKKIWGERYRNYYGIDVEVPTVKLDTLFGGVTPVRKGGGHQSKSLRLETQDGTQYVMRAMRKSAEIYLQALAFQEEYIEGEFENTHTEKLLLDVYTGAHPYAPFTVGTLSDAIGVYHTNPKLYYVPKQAGLGMYNSDFGDELYLVEERASSGHGDLESFGFHNKVISTDDLLAKLRKGDKHKVDQAAYIRARLLDMLIGDWDRHVDQWRWTVEKKEGYTLYKPIPRDRDQVFSKMGDGALLNLATKIVVPLQLLEGFDHEIRNVRGFNASPYSLDMTLVNETSKSIWEQQASYIQEHITDKVIDDALAFFPKELQDETVSIIKHKLQSRRAELNQTAMTYFEILNKLTIVRGTDKDDWFEIKILDKDRIEVTVYRIKKGKKTSKFYHKIITKEDTREIRIYGLDDTDRFEVLGTGRSPIKLRLIGGQNNDVYDTNGVRNVHIYDAKTKKNTVENAKSARLHLTNRYDLGVYNPTKLKKNTNQFVPLVGFNPDDGINLGFSNTYTANGFNQNPFTKQHQLKGAYYFATNGFDVQYNGEFANIFGNFNLGIEGHITSPNYSRNFFGFGNASENNDQEKGFDFNRVKLSIIKIAPSLIWRGQLGGFFKAKLSYEEVEVEETAGRFINEFLQTTQEIDKGFIGVDALYEYKNQDSEAFPTLGMLFSIQSGYKINPEMQEQRFGYLIPTLGFDYKLISSGKLVLATKWKAHWNFGDGFQFFQAASLGATDGLRGYRNQRFTGASAFYQSTDLRWNITKVKTSFLPIYMGVYGGFDYGRVWADHDLSNRWNTSSGGGIFFNGANILTARMALFASDEGARFSFGVGFGF